MPATKNLYLDGVNGPYSFTRKLKESSASLTTSSPSNTLATVPTANRYTDPLPSRGGASNLVTQNSATPAPDGTGFELDSSAMDGLHMESGSALSLVVNTVSGNSFQGYLYAELWIRRGDSYVQKVGSLQSALTTFSATDSPTLTGSQFLSQQFLAGDRLYLHFFLYITTTETGTTAFQINQGDGNVLQITTLTHAEYQATYAPPNDDFATAIELTGQSGVQNRSNFRASYEEGEPVPEIGEPDFQNIDGTGSVWYKWHCPADGSVTRFYADTTVTTSNSRVFNNLIINTRMAVYTGSSVGELTQVAYNDDKEPYSDNAFFTPDSNMSPKKCAKLDFAPVPGETYYFQICTQSYNYSGGSGLDTWSGDIKLAWMATGKGAWIAPPRTTITGGTAGAPWNLTANVPIPGGGGAHTSAGSGISRVWAGGWYMWRSFEGASPADHPGAYMCMTAHARHGDQSNHQYLFNNPDQGGWTSLGYGWASAGGAPGAYCAPLYNVEDWAALGYPGTPRAGSGLRSGGHCEFDAPGALGGELDYVECSWSFLGLRPGIAARNSQYWQQSGPLPTGAIGIMYEKEYCDVISLRVRPSTVGNSYHPPNGPGSDSISWFRVNVFDSAPAFGFFCPNPGGNPNNITYINGDPAQFMSTAMARIGGTDWSGGVQTGRTTDWYDCDALEELEPAPAGYGTGTERRYWFAAAADWIMAGESVGNPSPGVYSWTRRVDNMDLEVELVLQPPRYAYLYADRAVLEDPNLGVSPDIDKVHFYPPHPTGMPDVIVSQVQ